MKLLSKTLAGKINVIADRTADGKRVLVELEIRGGPAEYWMLDRTTKPTHLTEILDAHEHLPDAVIAPVKLVSYKARDGLDIPAYLTVPVGHTDGPWPFVVLPHGGPTAHDSRDFDFMVQFLASRGYGVLQPEFRGSSGFGAALERAGLQQWGRAMQDDVTDGTHWLIDQKLADPKRIAIVGGSYGGYAALMGTIREPALYRCALAFAPVADVAKLISDIRHTAFADLIFPGSVRATRISTRSRLSLRLPRLRCRSCSSTAHMTSRSRSSIPRKWNGRSRVLENRFRRSTWTAPITTSTERTIGRHS